jgi:hypothetical protein
MNGVAAQLPHLKAETPDLQHPLRVGELPPVLDLVPVRVGGGGISPGGDWSPGDGAVGIHVRVTYRLNRTTRADVASDTPITVWPVRRVVARREPRSSAYTFPAARTDP